MTPAHLVIKRCLVGAYASFLVATTVCFLLYPHILAHYNYGISYFGAVRITMVPYYLGLAGSAACLAAVAWQLREAGEEARPLRLGFWGAAVLLGGVAATSFSISHAVFVVHALFDAALTLNQLIVTGWILKHRKVTTLDYALAFVLVVTVVESVLPLIHHLPVIRSFPLREIIVFVCALTLMGRAVLNIKSRDLPHLPSPSVKM